MKSTGRTLRHSLNFLTLLTLLTLPTLLSAQDSVLYKALKKLPGIEVVGATRKGPQFTEAYEIKFTQPVDHNQPDGPKFTQRMFIGHVGFDRPMVLSTSGYDARGLGSAEPSKLL